MVTLKEKNLIHLNNPLRENLNIHRAGYHPPTHTHTHISTRAPTLSDLFISINNLCQSNEFIAKYDGKFLYGKKGIQCVGKQLYDSAEKNSIAAIWN